MVVSRRLSNAVYQKRVAVVGIDITIDDIERMVIRMMITGAPDPSLLVEAGEAELRELEEYVRGLPSTDYYIWTSPYSNFVMPNYVNVESIPTKQFDYELRIDAKEETKRNWVEFWKEKEKTE